MSHKILFIGDVVGKPGRKALARVLPLWQKQFVPSVTIVNVENLAHGKGVTPSTLAEIDQLNIDVFTSGNHIFKKGELSRAGFEKYPKLIRPANFASNLPGHGYYRFSKDDQQYLVINLNGQVFMDKQYDGNIANPFLTLDEVLRQEAQKDDIIFLDFHAEATSEKVAMGFYSDGSTTAMAGTHTHVPTADARILPNGSGYITDVGMTGALNSVLGVKKQNALVKFLEKGNFKNEPEEEGVMQVNGVLIEVESEKLKVKSIEKLYEEI